MAIHNIAVMIFTIEYCSYKGLTLDFHIMFFNKLIQNIEYCSYKGLTPK